ncbi:DUF6351 family protein [Variovorax sp. J22R115]|uniref:DUF6351 family protein n=1 Tax=Variovorax sp. J22R115 TaxID=3053509 RepID=UPI002575022A|nr:DUF6351 family protein [Variovorax sp. J22R115]MDM0052496.1 DUF6351 family protein [Variovorax sp. J22R115]
MNECWKRARMAAAWMSVGVSAVALVACGGGGSGGGSAFLPPSAQTPAGSDSGTGGVANPTTTDPDTQVPDTKVPDPGTPRPEVSLAGLKFWVNEMGPSGETAFSGPQQSAFLCLTQLSNLGAPEVDNHDGVGQPIYQVPGNASSPLLGYSKSCSVKTQLRYFYYTGTDFAPFNPATQFTTPPANLQRVRVNGVDVPFVVRVEAGTINRFAYSVAMLAPFAETTAQPQDLNNSAWNQKLVYWMRGGVGVGHQQGKAMWFGGLWSEEKPVMPRLLEQGYAVVSSSGNETGVHYNLQLGEETAVMVKEHFVQTYGTPKYTVAMGISGGAVQQYVYAQNRPKGLFDAGVPIQSYPDMVTQVPYVSDCPLLEQYFKDEVALDPSSMWATWSRRTLVEGLATSDVRPNSFLGGTGSSECIEGWGKAGPVVFNPVFTDPAFPSTAALLGWPNAFANVKWTHWNDLANIYGTDAQGFAPIPIDNVGVQYGLKALKDGAISAQEFLRINACAGSWKEQDEFLNWLLPPTDPFDSRNMRRSADCRTDAGTPAPRRSGNVKAMNLAYTSGQVFTGKTLDIPLIDLRPWKEDVLDMHNSRQSFSARARLAAGGGNAGNQVIWFTRETSTAGVATRATDALAVLDAYLTNDAKPARFVDQCFDAAGQTIGAGSQVWSGILDGGSAGACTQSFTVNTSPRMVAGDSYRGDMFKCASKPVASALADGTYAPSAGGGADPFSPAEKAWLNRIFPQGVCDYSKPDMGRPAGF